MTAVERQQTRIALTVSTAVHVLLVLWLAFFPDALKGPLAASPPDSSAGPVEFVLPLSDLVAALPEPDPPQPPPDPATEPQDYVRTTENQQSALAPDSPDFISDRNTVAATSEAPAETGPDSVPTIREGLDEPGNSVDERVFRDGPFLPESPAFPSADQARSSGAPPPSRPKTQVGIEALPPDPKAIPALPPPGEEADRVTQEVKETPVSDPAPDTRRDPVRQPESERPPAPNEENDTSDAPPSPPSRSTPAPSTVPVPDSARNAYQPETAKRKMEGTLSNRGDAAFDAENTPLGQYMKQVTDAVGRKWHRNIRMKDELISLGSMRVRFRVNRFGTPGDIRVVKRSTNTAVEDVTLRSILDAEIPPMPARVAEILDNGDLEVTYNVLIY